MARAVGAAGKTSKQSDLVPLICLALFAVAWLGLAISPRYRDAWLLENLITFVAVPAVVLTYRRFRISNTGYVLATSFLLLHTIGSHYTYSEVPVGDWVRDWLELSRNHYDRFVHFAFGLLMLRPLRELAIRRPAALGGAATFLVSVALVALGSVVYEVTEWWVAVISDPDAGHAFLGTQGDIWDAQWDMALACGGGIVAATIHALRGRQSDDAPAVVHRRLVRIRAIRTQTRAPL